MSALPLSPAPTFGERLWRWLAWSGPYAPLLALFVIGMPLLSLSRVGLMLWQIERVSATGVWGEMLLQGLRVDVIQLSLMSLPLLVLAPFLATAASWRLWCRLGYFWVLAMIGLLTLLEVASPAFISEYDTRPNRLFIEYLKYPHEVASMLWTGFRIHLFAGLIVPALIVWGVAVLTRPALQQENTWSRQRLWLSWPLILLLCLFSIRSSIDHRPANPALFAITNDPMVNTLILDSSWSVIHAIYGLKHENNSSEIYGKMSEAEMLAQVRAVREQLQDTRPLLGDKEIPTLTEQQATPHRERPLNLVIVLEESLGATFVESLGGAPVTPALEKLKKDGWWFEHMYATGTRSVRGIEAVVTGFPPTPAQSIVKLSLAQRNFSTLAAILGRRGYQSEFIYGGESHFDNMRGFFMANGFDSVIDEGDYTSPVFKGSWGVSDEDLFNKAHEQIAARHASGTPSFTLIFSSSNHAPFEFPDGRVKLFDKEKATDNNAVKYADYALGKFFEKARASDYWRDTVFLVVADHDIRVRGDSLVPIEHFHIPALILGAGIKPRRIATVASQIDLPTTLLSLIGIDARHPMIGRDLSREPDGLPGRAMMQYGDHYAWMEGQQVVILRPDKAPAYGSYDAQQKHLQNTAAPENAAAMAQRALGHVLLPAWLYREQRYSLPKEQ